MGGNASSTVSPSGTLEVVLEDETEDAVRLRVKKPHDEISKIELEITEKREWRKSKRRTEKLESVESHRLDGLHPKTSYRYRIRGCTATGWSDWSASVEYAWETRAAITVGRTLDENRPDATFEKLEDLAHVLNPLNSSKKDDYHKALYGRKREKRITERTSSLSLDEIKDVVITTNTQIAVDDINYQTDKKDAKALLRSLQNKQSKLKNVDENSEAAYLTLLDEEKQKKPTTSTDSSKGNALTHSEIQRVINLRAALLNINKGADQEKIDQIIKVLKEKPEALLIENSDEDTFVGYAVLLIEAKKKKDEYCAGLEERLLTWIEIKRAIDYFGPLKKANSCKSEDVIMHLKKLELDNLPEEADNLGVYFHDLIQRKQNKKEEEKEKEKSGLSMIRHLITRNIETAGPYAKCLTRRQMQEIVKRV